MTATYPLTIYGVIFDSEAQLEQHVREAEAVLWNPLSRPTDRKQADDFLAVAKAIIDP